MKKLDDNFARAAEAEDIALRQRGVVAGKAYAANAGPRPLARLLAQDEVLPNGLFKGLPPNCPWPDHIAEILWLGDSGNYLEQWERAVGAKNLRLLLDEIDPSVPSPFLVGFTTAVLEFGAEQLRKWKKKFPHR